ncbi:MAG: hypothetical protein KC766_20135 [Myxococcales bacterium]|nr:hypothetical protein [Myxococcales bacterium]
MSVLDEAFHRKLMAAPTVPVYSVRLTHSGRLTLHEGEAVDPAECSSTARPRRLLYFVCGSSWQARASKHRRLRGCVYPPRAGHGDNCTFAESRVSCEDALQLLAEYTEAGILRADRGWQTPLTTIVLEALSREVWTTTRRLLDSLRRRYIGRDDPDLSDTLRETLCQWQALGWTERKGVSEWRLLPPGVAVLGRMVEARMTRGGA